MLCCFNRYWSTLARDVPFAGLMVSSCQYLGVVEFDSDFGIFPFICIYLMVYRLWYLFISSMCLFPLLEFLALPCINILHHPGCYMSNYHESWALFLNFLKIKNICIIAVMLHMDFFVLYSELRFLFWFHLWVRNAVISNYLK